MPFFRSIFRSLREPAFRIDSAEGARTPVENPPDDETIRSIARDPAVQETFALVLRGGPQEDWGSDVAPR